MGLFQKHVTCLLDILLFSPDQIYQSGSNAVDKKPRNYGSKKSSNKGKQARVIKKHADVAKNKGASKEQVSHQSNYDRNPVFEREFVSFHGNTSFCDE